MGTDGSGGTAPAGARHGTADPAPDGDAPLILTARLDPASFARLDALRRTHFPTRLNRVPAHVTLFHHLPGRQRPAVVATLERACRALAPMPLAVSRPVFLGHGVAFALETPALAALRRRLAAAWADRLTPQDRQGFRPHVTIQNKVPPETARALHMALAAGFLPWEARVEGLCLWHYRGGPWEPAGRFRFGAAVDDAA
ncbi:2'-5' RNA ligase family protein [Roseomonas sp. NAR14]|uniref:2'-5' RNA ligase family protein n=1 Tax=Roseomonas acroporae TaxID=2937791 RepID=A0A9X1Y3E0_9PROT|nr:2'-5' RNA ligase family protein [Roseomonas acroporae]MCK8783189.1 2'-5' RNA ligase family protein [Roseomonas acroporae]